MTLSSEAPPALANKSQTPKWFWWAVAIIAVLAVFTRFYNVAEKPFHHDESLHAYYSQQVSQGAPHKYSALLHGPALYYITGTFFALFGVNEFTARGAAAFFGVLVVLLPLIARRQLGNWATLMGMGLLLISPTTMYFGRFLREDVFVTVWVLGTLFSALAWFHTKKPMYAYTANILMAMHFVNKENSYLHALIWGLGLLAIHLFWGEKKTDPVVLTKEQKDDRFYTRLNCALLFSAIYITFYTSIFHYVRFPGEWDARYNDASIASRFMAGFWEPMMNALYKESILYWVNQNSIRRIDGPFDYHIPIFANYEFLLIPVLFAAYARALISARKAYALGLLKKSFFFLGSARWARLSLFLPLILIAIVAVVPPIALEPSGCYSGVVCLDSVRESSEHTSLVHLLARTLHLAHTTHLLQIVLYVVMGGAAFFASLQLKRKWDAFLWFWITGAFGTYSYVGEKVPWLTVYLVLPAICLGALELGRLLGGSLPIDPALGVDEAQNPIYEPHFPWFRHLKTAMAIWLLVAVPFTLHKAWRAGVTRPSDPAERLVFTQSDVNTRNIRRRWVEAAAPNAHDPSTAVGLPPQYWGILAVEPRKPAKNIAVSMSGESTWPFAWYGYGFSGHSYSTPTKEEGEKFDVIMANTETLPTMQRDFPQYAIWETPMRVWWVPEKNPTWGQIFNYFFTGHPFGSNPAEWEAAEKDWKGDLKILYMERKTPGAPLADAPEPSFMRKVSDPSVLPTQVPPTVATPGEKTDGK